MGTYSKLHKVLNFPYGSSDTCHSGSWKCWTRIREQMFDPQMFRQYLKICLRPSIAQLDFIHTHPASDPSLPQPGPQSWPLPSILIMCSSFASYFVPSNALICALVPHAVIFAPPH